MEGSKGICSSCTGKAGLTITTEWLYGHDATHENADKISNDPAVQEADMLLAVGGGKCIDTR